MYEQQLTYALFDHYSRTTMLFQYIEYQHFFWIITHLRTHIFPSVKALYIGILLFWIAWLGQYILWHVPYTIFISDHMYILENFHCLYKYPFRNHVILRLELSNNTDNSFGWVQRWQGWLRKLNCLKISRAGDLRWASLITFMSAHPEEHPIFRPSSMHILWRVYFSLPELAVP